QRICPTCHTRVYNTNSGHGFVVLRAGTLDRSNELDCVAHMWVRRKQAWIAIPPGVPTWPEAPAMNELAAALGPVSHLSDFLRLRSPESALPAQLFYSLRPDTELPSLGAKQRCRSS